jgi:hypothetical protein
MMLTRKNRSVERKACLFGAFRNTNSHTDRPRIEPATPRCEDGD